MSMPSDDLVPDEKELLGEDADSLEALRARHADCPAVEILLASRAGVLPEVTARGVEAHVAKCRFCQILMEDLASEEQTAARTEEARRVRERVFAVVKPETKNARAGGGLLTIWSWKLAPISALAVAVIAVFVWIRLHPTNVPAPPAVTVVPSGPNLKAQTPLEWEKLSIQLQAQSILVWRGTPRTKQEKYASALASALTYYRDDNFAEAGKRLAKVAKDFPQGVEGQLYLGVTDLKLEQNSEALAPLQAAQRLGPEQFGDNATWYLALAYARTGDTLAARLELEELCSRKSRFSARACDAAGAISGHTGKSPRK